MSVTRFGVSLLNVVATIDRPASHQGTDLPEAKNSDVLLPDRLEKNSAGKKQMTSVNRTMPQSMGWRCIGGTLPARGAEKPTALPWDAVPRQSRGLFIRMTEVLAR